MYPHNTSFSPDNPTLQLYWDSTSYKAFKTCPFKYYLQNVCGYVPKRRSVHLAFGIAFHAAVEEYHRLCAKHIPHEEAVFLVLRAAYYRQLRTQAEKIAGHGHHEYSVPDDEKSAKTPKTLLRTILWYLDQFTETNDPAQTHILANGEPAVELSFSIPLDNGFFYSGHFDRIVEFNSHLWVTDYKTTTASLNAHYFGQWTPDIQMTGYTIASKIVFETPAKGILVDAARIGVTFTEFARQPINRTASQLDEFLSDLTLDLTIAKVYAENESWPMNPESCGNYGGCVFRKVCSHPPSVRENFLQADFTKRIWDPRKER